MPKAESIRVRLEFEQLTRLDAEVTRLQAQHPAAEVNRSTVVRAALSQYLKKEELPVTIKNVVNNLNGMKVSDNYPGEVFDDITCAFAGYTYEGETEVIISDSQHPNYNYQAYINHADAPIICIKFKDGVIEAWIA